ncbi:hypothetical protein V2I01_17055 [Micromonospora sp. BRA006-A]|nr:hypothetical protein [Micromonospora sp. BRA006-A]
MPSAAVPGVRHACSYAAIQAATRFLSMIASLPPGWVRVSQIGCRGSSLCTTTWACSAGRAVAK